MHEMKHIARARIAKSRATCAYPYSLLARIAAGDVERRAFRTLCARRLYITCATHCARTTLHARALRRDGAIGMNHGARGGTETRRRAETECGNRTGGETTCRSAGVRTNAAAPARLTSSPPQPVTSLPPHLLTSSPLHRFASSPCAASHSLLSPCLRVSVVNFPRLRAQGESPR
jgi:hypothetical protein